MKNIKFKKHDRVRSSLAAIGLFGLMIAMVFAPLAQAGEVTVDPNFSYAVGLDGSIYDVEIDSEGRIIIGGDISIYGGVSRGNILRLNVDGTVDETFDVGAGFNGAVNVFASDSNDKIVALGGFSEFDGEEVPALVRLNVDGSLDDTFTVDPSLSNYTIDTVVVDSSDRAIISGSFSDAPLSIGFVLRLNTDGSIDGTFDTADAFDGDGDYESVSTLMIDGDGKILIGGNFNLLYGVAVNNVGRLNANGSLDETFDSGDGFDSDNISAFAVATSGQIMVVGGFTTYDSASSTRIARLNVDGTLDETFDIGDGFDSAPRGVAIDENGKILVVGAFETYDGDAVGHVVRLNIDGILDNTFTTGAQFDQEVYDLAIQDDGDMLVVGTFREYDDNLAPGIVRLNADGSLDDGLYADIDTGFDGFVTATAIDSNGKIVVGGNFDQFAGIPREGIARLNTDGSIDESFVVDEDIESMSVTTLVVDSNGKIVVGASSIFLVGDVGNFRVMRLNQDGSIDNTFTQSAALDHASVGVVAIDSNGKIVVGGSNGNITRLNTDGSLDETFDLDASGDVNHLVLDSEDRVIVASPWEINGVEVTSRLVRIDLNGSLDETFDAEDAIGGIFPGHMAIDSDGRILVGDNNGSIVRLNTDGSLDETFVTGDGFDGSVASIVIAPDDRIIVGGSFLEFNSVPVGRLARLDSSGALDEEFEIDGDGFDGQVAVIAVAEDDSLFVGGNFKTFNGEPAAYFTRLIEGSSDPAVTLSATSVSLTEGESTSYTVVLETEPTGNVTVTISPSAGGLTISPTTLTFTDSNWDTPQEVDVTAIDNHVQDGNRTVTLSHTVGSGDADYNGFDVDDFTVSVIDNDESHSGGGGGGGGGGGSSNDSSSDDGNNDNEDEDVADDTDDTDTSTESESETTQLQNQINALTAQIQALIQKLLSQGITPSVPGAPASDFVFTRDLTLGSTGADVKALQEFLVQKNTGPAAQALAANGTTQYFGPLTRAALAEYQAANGIAPAVGYFGPVTRALVNGL